MANITADLTKIQTAIYGKEVRGALYNGLSAINNEVEGIDTKVTTATNLMKDTKELVDNSKDVVKNAVELNKELLRTNLILGSNFTNTTPLGGYRSKEYGFARACTGVPVIQGKTYTFTVCGFVNEEARNQGGQLKICLYDEKWTENGGTVLINDTTKTINSITFTATKTEYLSVASYLNPAQKYTDSSFVDVYWYSLVEGSTPVNEWSYCPYDIVGSLNLFSNSNFGINGVTTNLCSQFENVTELELQEGIPYTFTASASSDENIYRSGAVCTIFTDDWKESYKLFFEPNSPYFKSLTFTPQSSQKFKFRFYSMDINDNSRGVNCNLKWYSLVQGSVAQSWGPSIEDMRGKTNLQLVALGQQTTQMMLAHTIGQKQTQELGQTTSQLILENQQLKQQIKSIGKIMVQMQLDKRKAE